MENVSRKKKKGDGLKMERERGLEVAAEKNKRGERERGRKKYQTHLDWLAAMGHRVSSAHGSESE